MAGGGPEHEHDQDQAPPSPAEAQAAADRSKAALLAEAEGWEGIAERGDVAYIPCGLVHQIANVDPVLAVVTQVAGHPRCRVWDHEAGDWKTVHKDPKMEKLFEEAIGGTDEREDLDEEGGRDEVEL